MKNNEDGGHREKNDEKPDISISHYKNELYNFLRFIAFTILVTFKSSVIRP